ncbi:hypothetical protein HHL21_18040 [Massilia sp. RP-1-19]|uniref:Uncharacterized protein n=1 Tax=Massilia polaris TaxID=2728846 RepID=A0A848HP51_9BURK|nr:hypothetical protein [Massilia polaris]NML62944.1 hypothetical protein [Massilia polaris]
MYGGNGFVGQGTEGEITAVLMSAHHIFESSSNQRVAQKLIALKAMIVVPTPPLP